MKQFFVLAKRSKGQILYEKKQYLRADRVLVESANERIRIKEMTGSIVDPVIIPNGVDTDFFRSTVDEAREEERKKREEKVLVFIGTMKTQPIRIMPTCRTLKATLGTTSPFITIMLGTETYRTDC